MSDSESLPVNASTTVEDAGTALSRKEITAAEALEKLRRGEFLEHCKISRLYLRGDFPLPVRLRNCTLIRPEFDGAAFQGEVTIQNCILDRPRCGRACTFQQSLSLANSTLLKAELRQWTVHGLFTMPHVTAKGKFLLTNCQFHGKFNGWEARFAGWVDINNCTFAQEADCRSMHFEQGVQLVKCHFHGAFLFRGSLVEKKFQLDGSTFEGLLDLSKAKLHDFVYMEGILQGEKQQFAFLNTVAERILVKPEQIEGRLSSEETGRHEDAMREYGLLKQSFNQLHRFDMEDWAFYRFKVNQRRAIPRDWNRPWTKLRELFNWFFLDVGCGYGTNPVRAVRMALGIIIAFAVIYMSFIEKFHVEKKPFPDEPVENFANRLMISFMISVSVFTSGLSGIRDLARDWMNIPLIIQSVLGTFLWGLFIVAFSRKVIR